MSAVVNPYIVEPGARPKPEPDLVEILQMVARQLPRDDPGVALDARNAGQHPFDRRRQRYPPRAGFPVANPDLARGAVDIVPAQGDDLVLPAARQQQQPDRRDPRGTEPALRLRLVQHPAEPAVLLRRQEPLAASPLVEPHRPARIASRRRHAPGLGQLEHLGQHHHRLVRLHRLVPHPEMKLGHMRALDRRHRQMSQFGQDVEIEHAPKRLHRARTAVHFEVGLDVALGQLGHCRRRRRRMRERILAAPDAVDDPRRLDARLGRRNLPMYADLDAFRLARRPPDLDHVDLASARIHPDAETGEVPVPEQRIAALDGHALHRPLGNPNGLLSRHLSQPASRKRSVTR